MTSLLLSLLLTFSTAQTPELEQEAPTPPHLIATLLISPASAFPDFLNASVTVHAIPYVDIETGAGLSLTNFTFYGRAGPRLLIRDWRDHARRGVTLRTSALVGFKQFFNFSGAAPLAFNTVATADATYWVASHFGLSTQIAAGAIVVPERTPRVLPDLRLAFGLSF